MSQEFRVNFMIVGAQKSGTTSLAQMLSNHPSIVSCNKKEPMFFSSCKNWRNELSDYHSLYQWQQGALHFEASTSYTCYPHVNLKIWEDLYAYNPNLKIIYIVRNPIDRIVSSYMHLYKRGYIDLDIEKAIVDKPVLLNITRYITQIKPYIRQFGSEQVQILFFEDFIRNRDKIVNQLSSFLNISVNGFNGNNIHANKSIENFKTHHKYDKPGYILSRVKQYFPPLWKIITDNSKRSFKRKPKLSTKTQEMILFLLEREIKELEEITGRNLDHWRELEEVPEPEDRYDYHLTWYEAKMKLLNRIGNKLKPSRH